MRKSLHHLHQAIFGEIGMSNELEDLYKSLVIGVVPSLWKKLAPETQMNLASWIVHFKKRQQQYAEWVKAEPYVMWLSGLHVPESYLKALMQTACRKNGWPLDKTTLFTKVTKFTDPKSITERPPTGCYVHGLFMEGANWDNEKNCLKKQDPKQLIVEMPIMQIIPVETNRLRLQNSFTTPVYATQERANKMGAGLVLEADLPTTEHPSHWILQGVCLILNKND
jgi:dynein heavy chain